MSSPLPGGARSGEVNISFPPENIGVVADRNVAHMGQLRLDGIAGSVIHRHFVDRVAWVIGRELWDGRP